uniref:Peptidase_M13 domain-containing protein n=1 Tax=Panagrellus redivivus TaxID=6233 RepID=A0A7E4ZS02_PANRE
MFRRSEPWRISFLILFVSQFCFTTPANADVLKSIVDPTAKDFGNQVCVTKECAKAAAMLVLYMNEKINPCDDFSGFVCDNYKLHHDAVYPNDYHMPTYELSRLNHKRMVDLLTGPPSPNEKPWHKLTKVYLKKCRDKNSIKRTGKQAILSLLDEIGGWPMIKPQLQEFNTSWEEYMAMVNLKYNSIIFKWHIGQNPVNHSETALILSHPKFDDTSGVAELAKFLGVDSNVTAEMKKHGTPESKIKKAVMKFSYSRCLSGPLVGPLKLVKEKFPNFDLEKYVKRLFDGIPITDDLTIVITCQEVFREIHTLGENKRDLANYVGLCAALDIYRRKNGCLKSAIDNYLLEPVAQIYAAKYFDYDAAVPKVKEMIGLIKETLREMINNATWLDDSTRQNAIKKLEWMRDVVAFDKTLLSDKIMYEKWNVSFKTTDSFYTLSARINEQLLSYSLKQWNKPPKFNWIFNDANAMYKRPENAMYVGAPILDVPIFHPNVPNYINFAGIGEIIGHEIMHGFDDQGRKYDEIGKQKNWWTSATSQKYREKEMCYIDQYENHGIDGMETLGENIADNVGTKLAYYAYKKLLARRGVDTEPALPGFEKYTVDQMFFMFFALVAKVRCQDEKSDPKSQ